MDSQQVETHREIAGLGSDYINYVASKQTFHESYGFEPKTLNPSLFDWQAEIVRWALRKGRACLFEDCGLGKTIQQLAWAEQIPGDVLILTPLAVAEQTAAEAKRFRIDAEVSRDGIKHGQITITNYEQMHRFDLDSFTGLVLDESSILKAQTGKIRTAIINAAANIPYRLACTATPAPNDHIELGNHAEFVGAMKTGEMLARFFVHDAAKTQDWRLKGHARADFWEWVATWAIMLRTPEDIGYDGSKFVLPKLTTVEHHITTDIVQDGELFAMPVLSLNDQRRARKHTIGTRVDEVAALANSSDESWVIWCELNAEGDLIAKSIPDAVQVSGKDSDEFKTMAAAWFIGNKCICNERMFSAKLSEWKKTRKSDVNTCESGPRKTKGRSRNTGKKQKTTVIEGDANSTPEMNTDASTNEKRPANGKSGTERSGSPKDSSNMGLALPATDPCSNAKEAVAPFADERNLPTRLKHQYPKTDQDDFTSITVTKQEKSEDCCAPPATSGLDCSTTTRKDLPDPQCICGFRTGRRVLVSKPRMFGYGLNFQHCHNVAFVGLSHSWEQFYQAVRRCWRFGQESPVAVHIVSTDIEAAVLKNIRKKQASADEMAAEMVLRMKDTMIEELTGKTQALDTIQTGEVVRGDGWTMHHGDCVDIVSTMETESVGYSMFSPPFASLYTYTDDPRDMGNCSDRDAFFDHFKFLIPELYRVTKPGRLLSFHCMDLPTSKARDGFIGLSDFRGHLIKAFVDEGWILHSQVCIWKDPVTAMQRTKALGLLHKTIRKDSAMSRQGIPDYLVTMRKPGANEDPISHGDDFPVSLWQRYASPVWMDINPSDTLQFRSARDHEDERHICPLQIEVIRRALKLWSKPGDLVLSPFAGIGSEGFVSLDCGRDFVGVELKPSYFKAACQNLSMVSDQGSLFGKVS